MTDNAFVPPERLPLGPPRRRAIGPIPISPGWGWLGLVVGLVANYALINSHLLTNLPAGVNIYLAQPLIWLGLAALAYGGWRRLAERPIPRGAHAIWAGGAGLFQVVAFMLAGLLLGFGASPYSHGIPSVFGNLFYVVAGLVGVEMARAFLLHRAGERRQGLAFGLIIPFFTLLGLQVARMGMLRAPLEMFRFTGAILLPALAENTLATFLALVGGPLPAIVYRLTLHLFEWLSPILPRLPWTTTAFLGTLIPACALLVVRAQFAPEAEDGASPGGESSAANGGLWLMVALGAVGVFWLNSGLLGVQPTLVSGVSMRPTFKAGDLVIVRVVPPEDVEVGDVIRFRRSGNDILHRVIEIQGEEGQRVFITKGDGNNVVDRPVPQDQLRGEVVLLLPKIGWVSILIRRALPWLG